MGLDGVSNPVDMNAGNIFEPLLQIVQNYKFNLVSSTEKLMSQCAHVISDVSQAFGRIFPAKQQNMHQRATGMAGVTRSEAGFVVSQFFDASVYHTCYACPEYFT